MELSHLIKLINELTPNFKCRYVRGDDYCTYLGIDISEPRVHSLTRIGEPHSIAGSYLEKLAESIKPYEPFNISQLMNNSGSNRPIIETIVAHTSEFYWIQKDRAKYVVWIPTCTHNAGELVEWTDLNKLLLMRRRSLSFDNSKRKATLQTIYFGSPGTGKSFKVKNNILAGVEEDFIFRTTFHPDSDNSSFIGTFKPMSTYHSHNKTFTKDEIIDLFYSSNNEILYPEAIKARYWYVALTHAPDIKRLGLTPGFIAQELEKRGFSTTKYINELNCIFKIYEWLKSDGIINDSTFSYQFEPQVFTNAYIKAWQNPDKQVFLVIEEINRGNCAQIFGDLFQLLDRKDGISEYPVKADAALTQYLKEVLTGDAAQGIDGDMLRLPSNLNIIATMNTSDQSLFPMDSAFKRRWDWKYIPTLPPINEDKSFDLHFDSETISIDGKNIDAGDYEYSWTDFLKKINEKIFTATHSEDKQLGFWFVKTENPTNEIPISTFVSKVVFYLWNDVFKDLGPKGSNPFTIQKDGKSEVMHYNTFFEYNAKGEIVENMGVLHTFLRNVGLTPEPKKEIINAQEADILQHDA